MKELLAAYLTAKAEETELRGKYNLLAAAVEKAHQRTVIASVGVANLLNGSSMVVGDTVYTCGPRGIDETRLYRDSHSIN